MKKTIALLIITTALFGCNTKFELENDDNGVTTRRTVEKSPLNDVDIEMRGDIIFNEDGTEITAIPEGGYVKYSKNEVAIEARPGENNKVEVHISENGEEIPKDSDKGKEYLEEAIVRLQELQQAP